MSDSMLDRVARAIFEKEARVKDVRWEDADHVLALYPIDQSVPAVSVTDYYRGIARAAIEAMRDVDRGTPAILAAGKKALYSCSSDPELEDARGCWQVMVDAALKEGP
jgi:hypothetical protein